MCPQIFTASESEPVPCAAVIVLTVKVAANDVVAAKFVDTFNGIVFTVFPLVGVVT